MGFTPGLSHFRLLHPGFARFALYPLYPGFPRVLPNQHTTLPGFYPIFSQSRFAHFYQQFSLPAGSYLGNLGKPRLAGTRSTGMAGLGMFYQKSAIAVTMPIVTAFKFCICIGHRKNELLNR